MRPQNQYGMASDPADPDRLTKQPLPDEDIRDPDEDIEDLMPDDDDDEDADDDEITAADLPADVVPDDDGLDDDDAEEEPVKDTDKNDMTDAAQMVHSCENCGKENYVLAPKGFRYAKAKTAAKPAGLTQRLKHIGEALAPVFVFKSMYREARKPRRAPFAS